MIELHHVTFNYSAQEEEGVPPALQDVHLQIHEGQTLAIIGHNGSGKSTLSRLIAGILHPQRGSILVDGLNGSASERDLWAIRQRVGMVFQNPDEQLIASTVIDDIAFGPENLTLPRQEIEHRVQEALDLLQLTPYAQMSISELSVSLKQRVAIAGVLAMRPRYLILDEPTAMISGHTAQQLLRTLHHLAHTQKIAVIHITHFMHEITAFDRVIVMDAGRVLMDGTPAAIFSRIAELQAIGLDVPMVTHLGLRLAAQGWRESGSPPAVVLSPEQLVEEFFLKLEDASTSTKEPETADQHAVLARQDTTPVVYEVKELELPLFALKDVTYTYRRNTPFAQSALQGMTLNLPASRFIGLVGPTGSGKSTLVDILAGLVKPQSGLLLFDGVDTTGAAFKLKRIRARVGVVFQSPDLQLFEETVGKDVSFGPRQKKLSLAESRRRVQESLQAVGLNYEDFRSRYTYALSGGEKRRVAIAGVLALQPDVLLFDEPMAGLDPRGRGELFALLQSLKQRGTFTIIYATSSLKDVIELADSIHILEHGHLAFSGTPREILRRVAALDELDIALPEAVQIALTLRQRLPTLRTDVLNREELEAALHQVHARTDRGGETFHAPRLYE